VKKKPANNSSRSKKSPNIGDGDDAISQFEAAANLRSIQAFQNQWIARLAAQAADGESRSFALLLDLSISSVLAIKNLTQQNLAAAREVARTSVIWPTLISQSPKLYEEPPDLVKQLELGKNAKVPLNLKKTFREATIPRKIAVFLILYTENLRLFAKLCFEQLQMQEILQDLLDAKAENAETLISLTKSQIRRHDEDKRERVKSSNEMLAQVASIIGISHALHHEQFRSFPAEACTLPHLTAKTYCKWADFGKNVILTLTNNHPEQNVVLRPLGEYRKDAYYRKDTNNFSEFVKRKKNAKAKNTEETNISDGIFTRIREAYHVVLNESGGVDLLRGNLPHNTGSKIKGKPAIL